MKKLRTPILVIILALLAFTAGYAVGKGPRLITMLLSSGGTADPSYQRLASVEAFDELLASVDDIRTMVLAEAESEREVAQGMRWILRIVAMTTDIIGDANPLRPHFVRMDTAARKIGGDNPDGEYHLATIDGRHDYRIDGNRGSVRYFSLNVNAGRGVTERRLAAFLNDETIEFDEAGNLVQSTDGKFNAHLADLYYKQRLMLGRDRLYKHVAEHRPDLVSAEPRPCFTRSGRWASTRSWARTLGTRHRGLRTARTDRSGRAEPSRPATSTCRRWWRRSSTRSGGRAAGKRYGTTFDQHHGVRPEGS